MKEKNNNKKKRTNNGINLKSNANKKVTYNYISPTENPKYGYCEYVISLDAAKAILETRKGEEKKVDAQKYLCDYINEQGGLLGYCIRVKYV